MDNSVRLWDPKSGKPDGEGMKGHTKWITSLSWEPIHLYDIFSPIHIEFSFEGADVNELTFVQEPIKSEIGVEFEGFYG